MFCVFVVFFFYVCLFNVFIFLIVRIDGVNMLILGGWVFIIIVVVCVFFGCWMCKR